MFRKIVSKDKIRYNDDGYDLDLALINQRIIAMGFPSTGFASTYRNPAIEVAKFLDEKFFGHYKVYNLTETPYHESIFNGPVEDYPFPDHHAPPFNTLLRILNSIHAWLQDNPDNVIAVHCLAGMGRTGTIISSALIFERFMADASSALLHFSQVRTGTESGVKMPSQIRYVHYVDRHLRCCREQNLDISVPPISFKRKLLKITITDPLNGKSYRPVLIIYDESYDIIYNSAWFREVKASAGLTLEYNVNMEVIGDFTIKLYNAHNKLSMKELFRTTHHSSFIEGNSLSYSKMDLDGPHKGGKKYSPNFSFMCAFAPPTNPMNLDNKLMYPSTRSASVGRTVNMTTTRNAPGNGRHISVSCHAPQESFT